SRLGRNHNRLILKSNPSTANSLFSHHSLFNRSITATNLLKTTTQKLICQRCNSLNHRHHNMCPKTSILDNTRTSTYSSQILALQLLNHVPVLPRVGDLHDVHEFGNAR